MAQEKEIDIPPTETTLICFQPPNPAPTSPTHNPIPATSRSEEILIASLPETPSTDQRFYEPELIAAANRCSGCRRKVGLTGFRCRCGELFCGKHRYSDRHDCSFDYKTAGRISISRDNPVVRAAKIVRI